MPLAHAEVAFAECVAAAIDELASLAGDLLTPAVADALAAARTRIAARRCNLVVIGEFKRGKSTLINALLGRHLLPTGVVPLTSVVTVIGAGARERLVIRFHDGREEERPLTELAAYVTEAANPHNRLGVRQARVELDHELLRAGLEIVDTPGIGSIHSHNTAAAREFLPHVDAAVCVLDAGQPLSDGERRLLTDAAQRVPRLLVVVNKVDHLSKADRAVAVKFVTRALADLLDRGGTEVLAVSARTGHGVPGLVDRLRRLAADERGELLVRSVAGLVRAAAADVVQAARFEASAIRVPLDELDRRARVFAQRIEELEAAGAEAADLLERGAARALARHVSEPLADLAAREEGRLRAAVLDRAAQHPHASPRELARELESWIADTVRTEFADLVPRFETSIADELSRIEHAYADRVRRILEEVQETAEYVFGARAAEAMPTTGLEAPSRFSFKLQDVEHALDIIAAFGRTAMPGPLGRRLVIRDAQQRLVEMTDRHAGRLRSELAARVTRAVADYRRQLGRTVQESVAAITRAVERASDERRRGEQHARARLQRLTEVTQRCQELAASMISWLETSA